MKLDGREFDGASQQITAAQNDYLVGHLRSSGILEIIHRLEGKTEESEIGPLREEFSTRIMLSGLKSRIIAGCLTEQGKKWTRIQAERNAEAFDAITDMEEQRQMTAVLAGVVMAFFPLGEKSSPISPNSLESTDEVQGTTSEAQGILETSAQYCEN